MSKNTNTGLTKISKYGSRIPHSAAATRPASRLRPPAPSYSAIAEQHVARTSRLRPPAAPSYRPITEHHLGRIVRVADKEGVLRYVGGVQFSKGVWCGLELNTASGKNDGSVNGVRYFECAAGRGLMAPLSKVTLVEEKAGSSESLGDEVSGPYSMLFIDPSAATSNGTYLLNRNHEQTFSLQQQQKNDTYDIEDDRLIHNDTICIKNKQTANRNLTHRRDELDDTQTESNTKNQKLDNLLIRNLNETIDRPKSLNHTRNSISANATILQPLILNQICYSTPLRSEFNDSFLLRSRLSTISTLDNQTGNDSDSKRDSLECEESLGILTPGQIEENPSPFDGFLDGIPFLPDTTEMQSPLEQFGETKNLDITLVNDPEQSGRLARVPSSVDLNCTHTYEENANRKDTSTDLNETFRKYSTTSNHTLPQTVQTREELPSPNLNSTTEYSFGIINDQILSNVTLITDTTMNLELALDSIDKSKDFSAARLEQTPSPEELPLDPTPIVEMDSKAEPIKSKTSNCFITSITSITSIDTGYQGDGEMSRPASRGADNSPLTRRPLPRPQPRRQDPMTDSDFYTESDADNHEDNPLRGDRRAQVIDGTLYGVDPQAAADIYVNNRENMDSSGIFTDLENNTSSRNEDDIEVLQVPDPSPSDVSTKTISENSQSNLQEILEKNSERKDAEKPTAAKDNPKKRTASSPIVLSPSTVASPRHALKEDGQIKKYKMPKRDVPSKLKAMLEPNMGMVIEKKVLKKQAGRWDSVMNKISKNEQNKTNLKDVKSKVFNNVNVNTTPRPVENRKSNSKPVGSQKVSNSKLKSPVVTGKENLLDPSPKIITLIRAPSVTLSPQVYQSKTTPLKRPRSAQSNNSAEKRRVRNRLNSGSTPKISGNLESSIHSSLSDLSAATLPPNNKTIGSTKKRSDVVQVTQVLTANKLSPRNQQQQNAIENKKNATLYTSPSKSRRNLFLSKPEKQVPNKECGRGTVKGGRTSPTVRQGQQQQQQQPQSQQAKLCQIVGRTQPQTQVAEGLAVLLQHLVFNVGAFQVPTLRKHVEKYRREAEELRLALAGEKVHYQQLLESERTRCQNDIELLEEEHRNEVKKLTSQHVELEKRLLTQIENSKQNLCKQHEDQLATLKSEFVKLQKSHEESLEILREENDAISEQVDERRAELEKMRHESRKLKEDYESREVELKEHNQKLEQKIASLQSQYEEKIAKLNEERKQLREENDRLLGYGDDNGIGLQEVQSLRAVLELKQTEISDLRKALEKATHKADLYEAAEEKARCLNARCEDLELQLQRKTDFEKSLINENLKLHESFKEENNQNRRLSRYNEELKWKLEQNKEVVAKVFELQPCQSSFNRSIISSSYNERHSLTKCNLERTMSFRDRTYSNRSSRSPEESIRCRKDLDFEIDDLSPPTSPKVKGVVEKSDSVSYVLDLNESPEVVASRIVRRSFRNTTPPKNTTPTKSPSNKRPRIRVSLTQSASSSAIISPTKHETERSHSANRNIDCEDDDICFWSNNVANSTKYDGNMGNCESSNFGMKLDETFDLDEDNEVDVPLPALPSELNRRSGIQALPTPKHLAGDCMISESNSEDESTSSSQL